MSVISPLLFVKLLVSMAKLCHMVRGAKGVYESECQRLGLVLVETLGDIEITGAHIGIIARIIQGPGGCDVLHWQDILCRYGSFSRLLCDAVADLCRFLSNSFVDWTQIQALLSNRLIALDKSPGIRPIGVGETLHRILGKSVALVTKDDAQSVCGSKQL